jgi:hypothetical protein
MKKILFFYKDQDDKYHFDLLVGVLRCIRVMQEITGEKKPIRVQDMLKLEPLKAKESCEEILSGIFSNLAQENVDVSISGFQKEKIFEGEDFCGTIKISIDQKWSLEWSLKTGHSKIEEYHIDPTLLEMQEDYLEDRAIFLEENGKNIHPVLQPKPENIFMRLFQKPMVGNSDAQVDFVKEAVKVDDKLVHQTVKNILNNWNWDDEATQVSMLRIMGHTDFLTDDILKKCTSSGKAAIVVGLLNNPREGSRERIESLLNRIYSGDKISIVSKIIGRENKDDEEIIEKLLKTFDWSNSYKAQDMLDVIGKTRWFTNEILAEVPLDVRIYVLEKNDLRHFKDKVDDIIKTWPWDYKYNDNHCEAVISRTLPGFCECFTNHILDKMNPRIKCFFLKKALDFSGGLPEIKKKLNIF